MKTRILDVLSAYDNRVSQLMEENYDLKNENKVYKDVNEEVMNDCHMLHEKINYLEKTNTYDDNTVVDYLSRIGRNLSEEYKKKSNNEYEKMKQTMLSNYRSKYSQK